MISDPEPRRTPARGYGLRADELDARAFLGPAGYLRSCLSGQVAWPAGFLGIFGMSVALVYVMR